MPKTPTDIQRYTPEEIVHPSGIEIFSFDALYHLQEAETVIYADHRTSFYHIFRCSLHCKNPCAHYVEDKEVVFNNSLLFLNRDVSHRYPKRDACDGTIILFTDTFFASTYEKMEFLSHSTLFKSNYTLIPMQSSHYTTIVDLYFSLMQQLQPNDKTQTANTVIVRNLLHNLLMTIERECRLRAPRLSLSNDEQYMQQFKTLLDKHYETNKQVSFYALELGISEKKLSQVVHASRGISAKAYINEKMLSTAIFLLQNTTLNQAEIAQKLGLDAIYFLKFFHKHTGMTPSKYRQQEEETTSAR